MFEAGNCIEVETSKLEIEGQLAAYQSQDSLLEVKANQTGYVHYLTPLKQGMAIQKDTNNGRD